MSECPFGKRYKPLPLRRGFWREYPDRLKNGVVLWTKDESRRYDMMSAANSILLSHVQWRLRASFRRPALKAGRDFYAEFFRAYVEVSYAEECRIWDEIGCEVEQTFSERHVHGFTDKEAAYLTLVGLGQKEPPQSMELYMFLPSYARAYEELLHEKHGEQYTHEILYQRLREHMPKFLLQVIGTDMVVTFLTTLNLVSMPPRGPEGFILKPDVPLDLRLMDLDEDDKLFLLPKFIDAIHEQAREKGIKEDQNGRTEDRGCPVLFASERDAIITFAIDELIAQHELYHKT